MLYRIKQLLIRIPFPPHVIAYACIFFSVTMLIIVVIIASCSKNNRDDETPTPSSKRETTPRQDPLTVPVRPMPKSFPRDTSMPRTREIYASGAIDMETFSAGRDLIYVQDSRIYWESDHDTDGDVECDHSFHRALEEPFRRLHNLLLKQCPEAVLEVQEAFRPTGIHVKFSLHREGRAIDLTCDQIPLETLAKLCWAAGFDWVLYEHSRGTGPHIHASVKRTPLSERKTGSGKTMQNLPGSQEPN